METSDQNRRVSLFKVSQNILEPSGVNFRLWHANDLEHRLKPAKRLHTIKLSEEKSGMEDAEIEVEYQAQTIGKYDSDFTGNYFV